MRSNRRSKKKGRMLSSDLSIFLSSIRDTKNNKISLKRYEEDISYKMREEGKTLVSLKYMKKEDLDNFLEECGITKEFHRKRFIRHLKKYLIPNETFYVNSSVYLPRLRTSNLNVTNIDRGIRIGTTDED